jgi:DNA repair protein RecO (recombination protein O)
MIETSPGLVLRTRPLTDTSLIVEWLTPELGRLATAAKGARRPKSPFMGKLDLFYLADFSFVRSRRSDLHTLREVSLRQTHSGLRTDLGYLQQASYCAALLQQSTETETPIPEIFVLMREFLQVLPKSPPMPQNVFGFEIKLLTELGLTPGRSKAYLSAGGQGILNRLQQVDWPGIGMLRLSPAQTGELRHFLHGFIIYHLGRIPKGRDAAIGGLGLVARV